jgi:3-oxoacyl-[acyl-carrier-protein] synthase-1
MEYKKVFVVADAMVTSLGPGSQKNMEALYKGESGVRLINDPKLFPEPFMGAQMDSKQINRCFSNNAEFNQLDESFEFTRFEKMVISAMSGVYRQVKFPTDCKTLFILSTTKGNIDLIQKDQLKKWGKDRVMLWKAAEMIARFWGFENKPRVLSNACISGVEAISIGSQFIRQGLYENVIVVGADMLTEFVVSGFMSFQSLSSKVCKPFDEERDGLNLGEASACIFLSSNQDFLQKDKPEIEVLGGGSSNDANHISGPSRTGDGQFFAIRAALKEAKLKPSDIDYISAHGTATPYNDEMESKALNLAGLQVKPVNSLKAYFGHTLGAAGVLESIVAIRNLRDQKILKSLGYKKHGVPLPLNVIEETKEWPMKNVLKTASGFGGCNAAVIFGNRSRR